MKHPLALALAFALVSLVAPAARAAPPVTVWHAYREDSGEQKALAASVATFATQLVDPNAPDPVMMLDRIAHKHVSLGIRKDQYQIVHDNLMAAIAEVLGDAVTPEVAEAWDAVYWLMADVLIKHEAKLYESDGVTDGDVFRRAEVTAKEQLTESVFAYTLTGDFTAPRPGQYTSVGVTLDDGARQLRVGRGRAARAIAPADIAVDHERAPRDDIIVGRAAHALRQSDPLIRTSPRVHAALQTIR